MQDITNISDNIIDFIGLVSQKYNLSYVKVKSASTSQI